MSREGNQIEIEIGETRSSEASSTGPSQYDLPLAAGSKVGEYVIEAPLGSGGFGAVYRGVHPVIGKAAAVKVLSTKYSSDPTIVSRFVSEARAVNKIGHRNIIDIFSFGQLPDGRPYYVMELLDGMTLLELIGQRGRIPIAEALDILEPIASAIDAAHQAGVAHRDLKPDNIFLAREGQKWRPKLLDFGVAKLMDEELPRQHRTATGATLGTPAYMAPEQCIGRSVDHRADIYAFGVVAYEMTTGRLPFRGDSQFEIMSAHVSTTPPAPHEVAAELPPGFGQAILWLLEKDREQRPTNLAEAIATMRSTARGTPFEVAKTSTTMEEQPAPKFSDGAISASALATVPAEKSRMPALAIGAVVALAGTIGAFAFLGSGESGEEPAPVTPRVEAPIAATAVVPVSSPPPSAVTESPREKIKLEVRGVPANARIFGAAGEQIGTGPGTFEVSKHQEPISMFVEAPGFDRKLVQFTPDRDQSIAVQLVQTVAPRREGDATKRPAAQRTPISSGRGGKVDADGKRINDLEPWQ